MFKNPTNAKLKEMADVLSVPIWQLFVSPQDITGESDLTALIQHKVDFYKATTKTNLFLLFFDFCHNFLQFGYCGGFVEVYFV